MLLRSTPGLTPWPRNVITGSRSARADLPQVSGRVPIAATAVASGLPLYTRNPEDLVGLEELVTVVAV